MPEWVAELVVSWVLFGGALSTIVLVPLFFLLTLHKALGRVSPRNRLIAPGEVWLMLIPFFNFIWQFIVVIRVPGSLRNEFRARNRVRAGDCGRSIGLACAILNVVASVLALNGVDGYLVLSLVSLILFIGFWVKIARYSNQLARDDAGAHDWERTFDDDDDDGFGDRGPAMGLPRPPPDAIKEGDAGHYQ